MKTINPKFGVALALLHLLIMSNSAGAQDREVRNHTGFNAIEVRGGINLDIQQGKDYVVEVHTSVGDLDDVVTAVNGDTLVIGRRGSALHLFRWGDDASVHVILPKLDAVTASGGSNVRGEGTFVADALRLSASGGSDIEIDVMVDSLQVDASGGSDIKLTGAAKSARLRTSGGSDLKASRLVANEADLHASGGSDVSIGVVEKIVARASGGSDITYSGNPEIANIDTDRSGDVSRR